MPDKIDLQNKKEGAFMKKKIALLLTGTMVAGLFGGVMNVAADDSAEKIKITYMEWGDETRLLKHSIRMWILLLITVAAIIMIM